MLALCASTLALVVGGCGDSKKPASTTGAAAAAAAGPAAISKADWLAAADQLCREGRAERDALGEPRTLADIATFASAAAASLERQYQAIRDLGTPQGDRRTLGKLIDRFDREPKALRLIAKAAAAGDLEMVDATAIDPAIGLALDGAAKDAAAYGLRVCGTPER